MAENDSANKTEQPTPKKLKEGAKQGQVPRSTDIAAWTGLLALSFLLPLYIGFVSDELQQLLEMIPDVASEPSINRLTGIVWPGLIAVSLITVPLLVAILLVTQVSGWAQGGARPHLARIAPKTSKISPQQNGKRIFGTQGLWELVKQILKVTVIGLVLWIVITRTVEIVFGSGLLSLSTLAETAAAEGTRLVQVVIAAGLAIAIADYFVSQRRVRKQLMMSKREVKEEMKQSEGDPLLRAALRQRALEASRNRMMVDVAMADVVLVNPTHVSVALKYNQAMGAPRVVAKGAGVMAARIREIATENRVPLVEDVPLARALYRSCEIGTEIPADLYTAVARVLAFIMTLKKRGVHVGLHSARDVDRTVFI
ncbi:EscU/YscU/HrcU family type III secretion system export apparatus switch protein [bacterium]|jgi:flagellar biosynthetic protein FlhB|nr:EscU/YscU/HrcU family type III secretion system export apparatus switch protein [Actinomycetota bacterium]MDA9790916.1 EscU/YscU/HrcU family type III secretion system export apparatus switch protein [bacterium]